MRRPVGAVRRCHTGDRGGTDPESTLNLIVSEKVTLFRAGPIRRCRWPRWPPTQARICRRSPTAACPRCSPELRPRPGARANLFGMTESFGPLLRFPCRPGHARISLGQLRKAVRRSGGPDRRPVTGAPLGPGEPGEIQLRGKRILQGICGRTREDVDSPPKASTHRRPRPILTTTVSCSTGPLRRHVQGQRRHRHPSGAGRTARPRRRRRRLRHQRPRPQRPRVGAVVVSTSGATPEVPRGARELLSAFKVPSGLAGRHLRRRHPPAAPARSWPPNSATSSSPPDRPPWFRGGRVRWRKVARPLRPSLLRRFGLRIKKVFASATPSTCRPPAVRRQPCLTYGRPGHRTIDTEQEDVCAGTLLDL